MFSDILVIPYALGQEVKFKENIGPILGNINYEKLEVNLPQSLERLAPVFETIKLIKQKKKREGSNWVLWRSIYCFKLYDRTRYIKNS